MAAFQVRLVHHGFGPVEPLHHLQVPPGRGDAQRRDAETVLGQEMPRGLNQNFRTLKRLELWKKITWKKSEKYVVDNLNDDLDRL